MIAISLFFFGQYPSPFFFSSILLFICHLSFTFFFYPQFPFPFIIFLILIAVPLFSGSFFSRSPSHPFFSRSPSTSSFFFFLFSLLFLHRCHSFSFAIPVTLFYFSLLHRCHSFLLLPFLTSFVTPLPLLFFRDLHHFLLLLSVTASPPLLRRFFLKSI